MIPAITSVLMIVMQPCYDLTGNWWASIFLFTMLTKVVLLPMSLWCQWNAIVMVKLMPDLNRIKVKYFGDREAIGDKQNELYKERHYHPLLSLVPLAVQILILFGLVDVIHSITDHGAPGTEFLGMVPFEDGGVSWIMPLLAGLSAVVMGFAQNRINPLQKEQSRTEKNMTNGLSIGLSLFLGVFVAAGMCFYWICSNLSSVVIQAICNICIKPKKHIDYVDLEQSRAELEELNALDSGHSTKWYQRDPLARREKQDYKRFLKMIGKHIVFYSEGSGFYKYFKGPIEYLLANSEGLIHYVTNDPNDQIFKIAEDCSRIRPYYIGQKRAITLMMKMDADVVVLTLEDLDNYYIKRSYLRKDSEYVFFFHHMTSAHLVARKGALDHYDIVMCAGPHQVEELRRAEELYGTKRKNLVECGYALLDQTIADYDSLVASVDSEEHAEEHVGFNDKPTIVIAPSWQEDNILDSCIDEMLKNMLGRGWRMIVRPHPEYTKRYKARWQALVARYEDISDDELYFERDFSSNSTVYMSDVLITDWSSVACDFSFATLKPSIFVDTPMKVSNPDWRELGIEPTDITLRSQIGTSLSPKDVSSIGETVSLMIASQTEWRERIEAVREGFIFNVGGSSRIAGEYLLERILEKQAERGGKGVDCE